MSERCPYLKRKQAGDESYDLCDIKGRFCNEEHGYRCSIWDEIRAEGEVDQMETLEYIESPLIKEILEQERMILEMHKLLIEVLAHPPMIIKEDK